MQRRKKYKHKMELTEEARVVPKIFCGSKCKKIVCKGNLKTK